MQTEEDRRIQNKLENAGKGLPKTDAIFLKHIGFPILKTLMSWNIAMRFFESEGEKILTAVPAHSSSGRTSSGSFGQSIMG